jgi:FKBP-type peptidyl-prolyl cis-trans isomerase SlyD
MQVEKNRIVSIRYIMTNGKGVVLENIMESNPVNYLHGSKSIEQGLQKQLEGLKAGDRKKVFLPASAGLTTDDFEFDVIIDAVYNATGEEIVLGYPVNKYAQKCEADCECHTHPN